MLSYTLHEVMQNGFKLYRTLTCCVWIQRIVVPDICDF